MTERNEHKAAGSDRRGRRTEPERIGGCGYGAAHQMAAVVSGFFGRRSAFFIFGGYGGRKSPVRPRRRERGCAPGGSGARRDPASPRPRRGISGRGKDQPAFFRRSDARPARGRKNREERTGLSLRRTGGSGLFEGRDLVSANLEERLRRRGALRAGHGYDFAFAPDLIGVLAGYVSIFFPSPTITSATRGKGASRKPGKILKRSGSLMPAAGRAVDAAAPEYSISGTKDRHGGAEPGLFRAGPGQGQGPDRRLRAEADLVAVNIHWGGSTEEKRRERTDFGARDDRCRRGHHHRPSSSRDPGDRGLPR